MSYHREKIIKDKKYHYLEKNVRTNGKWKKFSIYIGKGELSKKQIQFLKGKYSKVLDERVDSYLRSINPLLNLLSDMQIKKLEEIKNRYNKEYRKLPPEGKQRYYEWFVTQFTYDTSAIEGSTATLRETGMILFDKIAPPGKTLYEVREIENHKKAFDFILSYKGDITKNFVLKIHKILTADILSKETSGKFRKVQVYIRGVEIIPPKPQELEKEFRKLMNWYKTGKKKYHPVIVASYFHSAFEGVHPFIDFNGRTGRLLLNFILMKNRFPAVDIKNKDRMEYYDALQKAQKGNLKPFVNLIIKYIEEIKSFY